MAAMFDLPVTPTSETIHTSPTVLLDPENVKVAVGIQLPATVQDLQSELQVFPVSRPPFWFPVKHGRILAWCDIVSGRDAFSVLEN